jgi:hypothetical protein
MNATIAGATITYNDRPRMTYEQQLVLIESLQSENAVLRECLIDATSSRDVLRLELDKAMHERNA